MHRASRAGLAGPTPGGDSSPDPASPGAEPPTPAVSVSSDHPPASAFRAGYTVRTPLSGKSVPPTSDPASPADDDRPADIPRWAWLPRDAEVFAIADPARCRPYVSPPVDRPETRQPGFAEPVHVLGDASDALDPDASWKLGTGADSTATPTAPHTANDPDADASTPPGMYAAVIKDSTTRAFEVRARAEWIRFGASPGPEPASAPSSASSSLASSPRVSIGSDAGHRAFSFDTPEVGLPPLAPRTPGFGSRGSVGSATSGVGGAASGSGFRSPRTSFDGTPPVVVDTTSPLSSAPSRGALAVASIFTSKYLQARRRGGRVQFFSNLRGVSETWELLGGAWHADGEWRGWGALDGVRGDRPEGAGGSRTPPAADESALAREMASLLGVARVEPRRLGGRDFCVVRSRRAPARALLLVRLTLPTGESVTSETPGKPRRARVPRWSESSVSVEVPTAASDSAGEVSSGFFRGGREMDVMDVVHMSERLLRNFARKPESGRRRALVSSAFHAWREVAVGARVSRLKRDKLRAVFRRRAARRAVAAWRLAMSDARTARQAELRSDRWRRARERFAARHALRTWCSRARTRWAGRAALVASLEKARALAWKDAFSRWRRRAAERRDDRRTAARAVRVFSRAFVSRAFAAWWRFASANAAARYGFEKVASRWRRLEKARLFRAWRERARFVADARRRHRRDFERDYRRVRRRLVFRAFSLWRLWTTSESRERRLDARAERAANEKFAIRVATRATRGWREVTSRAIRARGDEDRAQRAAVRILWRRRRAAFEAWRLATHPAKVRARVKTLRRDAELSRREGTKIWSMFQKTRRAHAQLRAMTRWKRYVTRRAIGRSTCALADRVLRRRRATATMRAWRDAASERTFAANTWRARCVHAARRRAEVKTRRDACRAWREWARDERRERVVADRSTRFSAKLERRVAGMSFDAWRFAAEEATIARRRVAEMTFRRVVDATADAFARWTAYARASATARRLARRATDRIRGRRLATAFGEWARVAAETAARRARAAADAVASNAARDAMTRLETIRVAREARLVGRVALRLRREAFDAYRDVVRRDRGLRYRLYKLLKRWNRINVTPAFDAWKSATRDSKRRAEAFRIVARRFARFEAARAFAAWVDFADDARRDASRGRVAVRFFLRLASRRDRNARESAFHEWRTITIASRRVRATCQRALERVRRGAARDAWDEWRRFGTRARLARRATSRMALARTRGAFDAWTWRVVDRRAWRQCVRKADRLMRRVLGRAHLDAFASWVDAFRYRRSVRRFLDVAKIRATRKRVVDAVDKWRRATRDARLIRALGDFASMRARSRRTVRAFGAWRVAMADAIFGARLAKLWTARARSVRARGCFSAWRLRADRRTRLLDVAERRVAHVVASATFRAWRKTHREDKAERRREAVAAHAMARFRDRACAAAFDAWLENAKTSLRLRRTLEKTVGRWRLRWIGGAFHRWIEAVEEAARCRRLMARALARASRRSAAAAFLRWVDALEDAKKRRRLETRARRFAERLRNRDGVVAFRSWVDVVEESKRERRVVDKIATRWSRLALASAFDRWVSRVEDLQRERRVVDKIATRWSRLALAEAFACWVDRVETLQRERRVVDKIARRWARLRLASAFACWCSGAASVRRERVLATRVASATVRLSLRVSFRRWLDVVSARRRDARALRRVAGMLARLSNRTLARSFAGWIDAAEDRKRLRLAASRVARRWIRGVVSDFFNRWRDFVDEERRVEKLFAKCARRVANARAAAAFDRWKGINARAARRRHARRAAEIRADRARAVAARVARRFAWRAFLGWRERAKERVRERRALAKLVSRWRRLETAYAFEDWRAWCETRVRERRVVARVVQTTRTASVRAAWRRWRESILERRDAAARTETLRRFSAAMTRRALGAGFRGWRDEAADRRRARRVAKKIAARWTRLVVSDAFGTWADAVDVAARHRAVARTFARRMTRVVEAAAFRRWTERVEYARLKREAAARCARFARRLSRRVEASAFDAWRDTTRARIDTRASLAKVARRWNRLALAHPFHTWVSRVEERAADVLLLRRAAHRARRVWLYAGFARWIELVDAARAFRAADVGRGRHMLRRVHFRWMREAFAALAAHARESMHLRDAAEVVAAHWRRGRVARRFAAWRGVASRNRRAREIARAATRRLVWGAARDAFYHWAELVVERRAHEKRVAVVARRARRGIKSGKARAFEAWRLRAFRAVAARAKRDAEEAAFMRDALGGERERKDATRRELETLRRESEGLSQLVERLQTETANLAETVASRDAQIAKLLEERNVVHGWMGRRGVNAAAIAAEEFAKTPPGSRPGSRSSTRPGSRSSTRPGSRPRPSPLGDERRVLEWDAADAEHERADPRETEPPETAETAEAPEIAEPSPDLDPSEDDDVPEPYAQSPPAMLTAYADRDAVDSFASPGSASRRSSPGAPASSSPPVSAAQSRLDRALRARPSRDATPTPTSKTRNRQTHPRSPPDRVAAVRGESPVPVPSPRLAVRPSARSPPSPAFLANAGPGPGPGPGLGPGPGPRPGPGPGPGLGPSASASVSVSAPRTRDPSFYADDAAARARGSIRDEDDVFGVYEDDEMFGAPLAYARVRPLDPRSDGASSRAALSPGAGADARAVAVVSDRGGVPFRQSFAFDRVFWGEDVAGEDVAVGVAAAAVAAPMFDAVAKTGRDATLLVVGAPGGGKTKIADAVVAALVARIAPMLEDEGDGERRVAMRVSMYETRGLVADDLLASFGGAAGLRVRPVNRVNGGGFSRGNTDGNGNGHAAAAAGLLYEVEDVTRRDVWSAREARDALELGRGRRAATNGSGTGPGPGPGSAREHHSACVTEIWLDVDTFAPTPGRDVDASGTPGRRRAAARVTRSACARVVDVDGGGGGDRGDRGGSPTFALHQCVRRLLAAEASGSRGGAGAPDWRGSALTKLMKAPMVGEGRLIVMVATGPTAAQAEEATAGLQLASAARRLRGARGRVDVTSRARRVADDGDASRRARLAAKLEKVRRDARAAVRNATGEKGAAGLAPTAVAAARERVAAARAERGGEAYARVGVDDGRDGLERDRYALDDERYDDDEEAYEEYASEVGFEHATGFERGRAGIPRVEPRTPTGTLRPSGRSNATRW